MLSDSYIDLKAGDTLLLLKNLSHHMIFYILEV